MTYKFVLPLAMLLLSAACSSDPDRVSPDNPFRPDRRSAQEQKLEAAQIYRVGRTLLESSDYQGAMDRYGILIIRFPFNEYAIQAQMEKIYALYRNYQYDEAQTDAERFLREHPRHAHADYVQYLKGLINFDREKGLSGFLGLDTSRQDVTWSRKSFDDFSLLVQKYPQSRYVADARQRMTHLRNLIAEHELHVVRYYTRRGAHVAASKRAEQIVAQYPGAPATLEALALLERNYAALGLDQQAGDAARLRAAQEAVTPAEDQPKKGWFDWF